MNDTLISAASVAGMKFNIDPLAYLKPVLSVRLEDPKAMPLRAYQTDAGADLFSSVKEMIYPGEMVTVDTGMSVAIPVGYVGLVCSRSGQGKIRVSLSNSIGVIDSTYRGNIKVMLLNEGDEPYEINPYATKIAQLMVIPIILPLFKGFTGSKEEWENTDRGTNGFGSTNKG